MKLLIMQSSALPVTLFLSAPDVFLSTQLPKMLWLFYFINVSDEYVNKFITKKLHLSVNREPPLHFSAVIYNRLQRAPTRIHVQR